jgi:uncharacterized protein YcbX
VTARVSWVSLTPVKALALEHVDEIELLQDGLRGDRPFGIHAAVVAPGRVRVGDPVSPL